MNSEEAQPSPWPAASKIAFAGALLLIMLIAALGLVPGTYQSIMRQSVQRLGHVTFFGALAFLTAIASPTVFPFARRHRSIQYIVGLTVSIGIGLALEVGQRFIPARISSLEDVFDNAIGALAAILLLFIVHHIHRGGWVWRLAQLAAVLALSACLGIAITPLALCWLDCQQRVKAMPYLIKLNEDWAWRFAELDETVGIEPTQRPSDWPHDAPDDQVRMIIRPGEPYPGLTVHEPIADWRPYRRFAFDVYSPMTIDQPLQLRIHDRDHNDVYHDRFNANFLIKPGHQTIRVSLVDVQQGPRNRELDLSRVAGFIIFVIEPRHEVELVVGNFRLE